MKIENMDKDKLITFLTSEDEELRNIGLEIIKNNFELNFDFYKGIINHHEKGHNIEYRDAEDRRSEKGAPPKGVFGALFRAAKDLPCGFIPFFGFIFAR